MFAETANFARPPAELPRLDECSFYHTIDLPELGTQKGHWDLRAGIDAYFGGFDLVGKTVLEIGTANGFVCFEMEHRGADVIAFDLHEGLTYDMFPGPVEERDPEGFRKGLGRIKAAYWLAHGLLGSEARVVYGHANNLPPFLDDLDVVIYGNVLQHLRDPIGALVHGAQRARAVIVTEADWKVGFADELPAMVWFEGATPYSWFQVKSHLVCGVLEALGFVVEAPKWHEQVMLSGVEYNRGQAPRARSWDDLKVPHYTVVARRPQ